MSSSMRNAVQRRNHRERAQPLERKRLGLLEKHKDYTLRAKDHASKKTHLKNLRLKAANRNEDEFYFGMLSRKGPGSALTRGSKAFDGTVRGDRGNKVLSVDVARLLKTQDVAYVRTVRNMVRKEVGRLREGVVLARGAGEGAGKIVFVDGVEERERLVGGLEGGGEGRGEVGGEGEEVGGFGDLDDLEGLDGMDVDEEEKEKERDLTEREKYIRRLERELSAAEKKLKALNEAEHAMEVQQAKMAKTATSGGFTRRGKKLVVHKRKR